MDNKKEEIWKILFLYKQDIELDLEQQEILEEYKIKLRSAFIWHLHEDFVILLTDFMEKKFTLQEFFAQFMAKNSEVEKLVEESIDQLCVFFTTDRGLKFSRLLTEVAEIMSLYWKVSRADPVDQEKYFPDIVNDLDKVYLKIRIFLNTDEESSDEK